MTTTTTTTVHLATPAARTRCGAPKPLDRVNGWTAYRSEVTCAACLSTLSTLSTN